MSLPLYLVDVAPLGVVFMADESGSFIQAQVWDRRYHLQPLWLHLHASDAKKSGGLTPLVLHVTV